MDSNNLNKYKGSFKNYTELRAQENISKNIGLTNGDVTSNSKIIKGGVSARVFQDGKWGFSSSPEINDDSINNVIKASNENAQFMSNKDNSRCGFFLPETQSNYHMDLKTKKNYQSQKYWLEFVKEIDGYIDRKYPELLSF